MKKEQYSHKDFTVQHLNNVSTQERIVEFQKYIDQLKNNNHEIFWTESKSGSKPEVEMVDEYGELKKFLSFVSNDYLGMSQNAETIQAGILGLNLYGTGVCAAPCIGGYLDIHKNLEKDLAEFVGAEKSMLFSSGYGANSGAVSALLGKNDLAIIDTGVHTSILDGLRSTNVKMIPHNKLDYLEVALKQEQHNYKTRMVIIDGVYSQDGDLSPLPEIIDLCKKYNALLLLDDAHGVGVIGENGRGTCEYYNVLGQVDLLTGTFSKAFGCVGGFVAGSKEVIQYLKYYANTTIFSAAIIPQVTFSVHKALDIIKSDTSLIRKLWENTNYLKSRLIAEGFDIGKTESPIIPFMVRDDYKVKEITIMLKKRGIYTVGIVYPAVRSKEARIRITVTAAHKTSDLDQLAECLCLIDNEMGVK